MQRQVTIIPATINPLTRLAVNQPRKRRVAGYARVSTDSEEQKTSYAAQVDYYTTYIQSREDWEFVDVYTDEGISGTNTKRREGFNRMIEDALAGKIDFIVTKSVSRFARNTVDTLSTVRQLKEKGIGVYFEKENIDTLDSKGELLITIMSSLAQEESRSISENITWGQRKRFADGKISLPYKSFLGYEKGENEIPRIVEEEAVIVRKIYALFMSGKTPGGIAQQLTEEGIPTPKGGSVWSPTTVKSILTNEKYKGSAILQKEFTVDFLSKKKKVNEGEVPQYYIEHSHEPIIDPREFDMVQAEMKRRKGMGKKYSGNTVFATRVICGDCGTMFGAKVWHSNSKYRKVIWQCNHKFHKGHHCQTPNVTEEELKARFLAAYSQVCDQRDEMLENCRLMQQTLTDCSAIESEIAEVMGEIEVISELVRKAISENSRAAQDQDEYNRKYDSLVKRYETAQKKLTALNEEKQRRNDQADAFGAFMFELMEYDEPPTAFDEKLWALVIDTVTIYADGRMVFHFRIGLDITA